MLLAFLLDPLQELVLPAVPSHTSESRTPLRAVGRVALAPDPHAVPPSWRELYLFTERPSHFITPASILPKPALGPPARQQHPNRRLRDTARTAGAPRPRGPHRTQYPFTGAEKAEFRGARPASQHIATPRSSEHCAQRPKFRSRGISDDRQLVPIVSSTVIE